MIGIYQFCCVITLNGMLNLPAELAATFGLVCHTIAIVYVLIAGFIVLTIEGLKFSELSHADEQAFSEKDTDIS